MSRVKLRPTGEAAVLIECAELVLVLAALREVLVNPQGTLLELGPSEPLAEVSARSHRAAPRRSDLLSASLDKASAILSSQC